MSENLVHESVCHYLRYQYPDVFFFSDGSGLKLPFSIAKRYAKLKSCRGVPDLFIAAPVETYCGLFLELKTEKVRPFLKSGKLTKNKHMKEQFYVLRHLQERGYAAFFACGVDQAITFIDYYMDERYEWLEKKTKVYTVAEEMENMYSV